MPCITMYREKISKMEKAQKKATIGILGRTGEGKSSLLNAIMEKENLLPPGCFGACTSVITQVEANLHDSHYIAEIEFISEEVCSLLYCNFYFAILLYCINKSNEMNICDVCCFILLQELNYRIASSDKTDETCQDMMTALFGADADDMILEDLKKKDDYAKLERLLSTKKIISERSVSYMIFLYIFKVENIKM